MKESLRHILLEHFTLQSGAVQDIHISYQLFGRALYSAPIILITHALTGNSNVTDWWPQQVGNGKTIDTSKYTIICFNIPGNGYDNDPEHLIFNYVEWQLCDVGYAFAKALQQLFITNIFAGIGGSIGGAILWEMTVQQPHLFKKIIPIAADWKATDWLIANCHIQENILLHSSNPVEDARQHAMTFYRTAASLKHKFNRAKNDLYRVQDWLNYHGKALENRFVLPAYLLVNRLLLTTNAARAHEDDIQKAMSQSRAKIYIINIDSDGFFLPDEDLDTVDLLKSSHQITLDTIISIHGHDAFLIEHDQVSTILKNCLVEQEQLQRN